MVIPIIVQYGGSVGSEAIIQNPKESKMVEEQHGSDLGHT
jgi:hypothetical protein